MTSKKSSRTGQQWANQWHSKSNARRSNLKEQSNKVKSLLESLGLQYIFSSPWDYPEGALRIPRTVSFEVQTTPPTTIRLDNRYDQESNAFQIESGPRTRNLCFQGLEKYFRDAAA